MHRRTRALTHALALSCLCWTPSASGRPLDWHLDTTFGTDFPISAGARLGLEMPGRVRVSSSFGSMSPYAAAIGGMLVAAGAYDQDANELVLDALDTAVVWRNHLGIRPFADHGFFVDAGYALAVIAGGADTAELVARIGDITLPSEVLARAPRAFRVGSTLHMVDVELGWEWTVVERIKVRTAVGGAFTFDAATSIESEPAAAPPEVRRAMRRAEAELDELYRTYAFTPVVSFGLGYVFF